MIEFYFEEYPPPLSPWNLDRTQTYHLSPPPTSRVVIWLRLEQSAYFIPHNRDCVKDGHLEKPVQWDSTLRLCAFGERKFHYHFRCQLRGGAARGCHLESLRVNKGSAELGQVMVSKNSTGNRKTQGETESCPTWSKIRLWALVTSNLFAHISLSLVSVLCNETVIMPTLRTQEWRVDPGSATSWEGDLNLSKLHFSHLQNGSNNICCWDQWVPIYPRHLFKLLPCAGCNFF